MTLKERQEYRRLRFLVLFDAAASLLGATSMLIAYVTTVHSGYFLLATGVVFVAAVAMLSALLPLEAAQPSSAVLRLSLANWGTALVVAGLVPFAWPILSIASLVPAVLAPPYMSRRRVALFVLVSLTTSVAVTCLGLLQDFSGLDTMAPVWLKRTVVVGFSPFMSGIVALVAFQNSSYLLDSRAALTAKAIELGRSRARIAAAANKERRRIEQDLHDGAQQRLLAVALILAEAERLHGHKSPDSADVLSEARKQLKAAQVCLRELTHGIYPHTLTSSGLAAALAGMTADPHLGDGIEVDVPPIGRFPATIEATVYFCCQEAVVNAKTHAGPGARITVSLRHDRRTNVLRFEVRDNGIGMDRTSIRRGRGLDNLADRLDSVGGRLDIVSAVGVGTTIGGSIPGGSYGQPYPATGTEDSGHSPPTPWAAVSN